MMNDRYMEVGLNWSYIEHGCAEGWEWPSCAMTSLCDPVGKSGGVGVHVQPFVLDPSPATPNMTSYFQNLPAFHGCKLNFNTYFEFFREIRNYYLCVPAGISARITGIQISLLRSIFKCARWWYAFVTFCIFWSHFINAWGDEPRYCKILLVQMPYLLLMPSTIIWENIISIYVLTYLFVVELSHP